MTKQVDLSQPLEDRDREWLEARGDVTSLRVNSAIVDGRDYVVREDPEVPSTLELSEKVGKAMLEEPTP